MDFKIPSSIRWMVSDMVRMIIREMKFEDMTVTRQSAMPRNPIMVSTAAPQQNIDRKTQRILRKITPRVTTRKTKNSHAENHQIIFDEGNHIGDDHRHPTEVKIGNLPVPVHDLPDLFDQTVFFVGEIGQVLPVFFRYQLQLVFLGR
jgi:hypothetical protein